MSGQQQQSDWNGGNSLYPIEPVRNGFRKVVGNFVVPRYGSDTIITWKENQTELQAQIVFTLSASYTITVKMPYIKLLKANVPTTSPEALTQVIEFQAFKNNSNSYMTDAASASISNELVIELKNERTATILS